MAANHVDHIEPHQGERSLLMQSENTQSLFLRHHNVIGIKREIPLRLGLQDQRRFEIIALYPSSKRSVIKAPVRQRSRCGASRTNKYQSANRESSGPR